MFRLMTLPTHARAEGRCAIPSQACNIWELELTEGPVTPGKQDPPAVGFLRVSADGEPKPRFAKVIFRWRMDGHVEVTYCNDDEVRE